jgi:hypothetical protein
MKEAITMATAPKTEGRNAHGVVPGVAHLALDIVDRSQSTTLAVLQDVRTELRAVVDTGIELAEKTSQAAFRLARKVTQRLDEGVAETLGSVERVVGGAVRSARDTALRAAELAHTAIGGVAGQPQASA